MQQLINFLLKNKHFLLFLLLLFISIVFTVQSRSYHKSKFINSANFITGGVYEKYANMSSYFHLKEENEKLVEENSKLRKLLVNTELQRINYNVVNTDNYKVHYAKVIHNNYNSRDNYLTLNKGTKNGIQQDYGVISSKGLVGVIRNTSSNFSTVLSILNSGGSKTNAQIKHTNHYATLEWNGEDPNILQLTNLPKLAKIKVGDTIETSTFSGIFPEGIPIGKINHFELNPNSNYYNVNIELFNDMTNLNHVYIIENTHKKELNELENSINE